MRKSVLHVIGQLTKGGAEKQLYLLCEGLILRGWEVHVLALSAGGFWKEKLESLGIEVYSIDARKNMEWRRVAFARKVISRVKPDVLHTWLFHGNSYGRLGAIFQKPPLVIASERMPAIKKSYREKMIDRILQHWTELMISNSQSGVDVICKNIGIPSSQTCVIYNGIDNWDLSTGETLPEDMTAVFKRSMKGSVSPLLIGATGRLVEMKGYQYLLQAIAQLLQDNVAVFLIILGDGPFRNQLEQQVKELDLTENVTLPGERNDVRRILPHLDLFVQCSEFEGFSNSLMEAMQTGLPVVATNVGGNPEMVTDFETGLLIPWADSEALKLAIIQLAESNELRTRLGTAARLSILEKFNVERMVDQMEELYMEHRPKTPRLICAVGYSSPGAPVLSVPL
jgi:glycosyltransferase involved in cell wall biosynthesis